MGISKKVALLGAIALTTSVFAQGSGINFRFSGDVSMTPYWEVAGGGYEFRDYRNESDMIGFIQKEKLDAVRNFYGEYGWNARFGFDIRDEFSIDLRLSNPSGLGSDLLPFANASGRGYRPSQNTENWLPTMPNAFFTYRVNDVFSLKAGLLEVKGNTTLDLVAGTERLMSGFDIEDFEDFDDLRGMGLYTSNDNWGTIYNNSQAGIKFGFDLSDAFSLNLTTAFPTNESPLRATGGSDMRFILDCEIEMGVLTLIPTIQTRVFRENYSNWKSNPSVEEFITREGIKDRNSFFWAYGLDAGIGLGDAFNLDLGFAFGHFVNGRWDGYDLDSRGGNIFVVHEWKARNRMTGVLLKVAPSLNFGVNEVALSYSLGFGNDALFWESMQSSDKEKFSNHVVSNDLNFDWQFRLNNNLSFGPFFSFVSDSYKTKYDVTWTDTSVEPNRTINEKVTDDFKFSLRHNHIGLSFNARF